MSIGQVFALAAAIYALSIGFLLYVFLLVFAARVLMRVLEVAADVMDRW